MVKVVWSSSQVGIMRSFARHRSVIIAWFLYVTAAAADQVSIGPAAPPHDEGDPEQHDVNPIGLRRAYGFFDDVPHDRRDSLCVTSFGPGCQSSGWYASVRRRVGTMPTWPS